ncbi:MAG: hypothetical protein HYX68_14345 [Planctomycetes bacterium]|nr:hypothetical protein [Planctomycetota bacterium]
MPTIREINQTLANKLYEEAQRDPLSPYAGKKVGFANGQIVVVADAWRDVTNALNKIEPVAANTFCIDMAQDYKTVQEIWEVCVASLQRNRFTYGNFGNAGEFALEC